jgi:threonine dehydratase
MTHLPTYDDVAAAATRIAGHAHKTPVLTSRTVNDEFGAEVFFKCENLQRMGAFKFRGAFNALSRFTPAQRKAGVVAFSSGNHAQAIALSARILDMEATILMPNDAPAAKVAATKGYGGKVVHFDRYTEDREQIGRALADQHGLTLIPSYDHVDVLAGQGTAAKELFEEVGPLDALFVPLGGGACCRVVRWPPEHWHRTASSTVSSRRRATTGRCRSGQEPSCTSTRPRRLPTGRRRSISAT